MLLVSLTPLFIYIIMDISVMLVGLWFCWTGFINR